MKKQIIFLLVLSANFVSAQQSKEFKNWANLVVDEINGLYNKPIEDYDSPITLDICKALFSKKCLNTKDLEKNVFSGFLHHNANFVHVNDAKSAVVRAGQKIKTQEENYKKKINKKLLEGVASAKNKEYKIEESIIRENVKSILTEFFVPLRNKLIKMMEEDKDVTFEQYKKIISDAIKKYLDENEKSIFKLEKNSFKIILKD